MDDLTEVLAIDDGNLDVKDKGRVALVKIDARKELDALRAFVMPDDEEGAQ